MRRPSKQQSALRNPLNVMLGAEANVRILRALAASDGPFSASEIARRTGLGLAGIAKSTAFLASTGIIESVGSGSRRPVRLRLEHPLAEAMRDLFRREREYFETLLARLRTTATKIAPAPLAIWIEGNVAAGEDRIGDPVIVGLLAPSVTVDRAREAMADALEPLDQELDVTLEVRAYSAADLEAMTREESRQLVDVIPLLGPPPLTLSSRATAASPRVHGVRSHADADARGRALGMAIADRLATDPSLVSRARAYVTARLSAAAVGEQRELREWDRILRTMSVARLRKFLTDPGERATRLRQTLPFLGVLTSEERERLASEITHRSAEDSST
jgi:hypothetical protein